MRIGELIAQIPEYPTHEALMAIESVMLHHHDNSARVRCHLSHEFRIRVRMTGHDVTLYAEGWPLVTCFPETFLGALQRLIHNIDAAISAGTYHQAPPKPTIIMDDRPTPPDDFDLPVWDAAQGTWYDAEY